VQPDTALSLLAIGQLLGSTKDSQTLLRELLVHARALLDAEGASIYATDGQELVISAAQNSEGSVTLFESPRFRAKTDSIAAHCVKHNVCLSIDDVYAIPADAPYRFDTTWDRTTGRRTRSMLTVPMTDKGHRPLGALQLINKRGAARNIVPFNEDDKGVAAALAGYAGLSLENLQLYGNIERLFEGFMRASITAIEARDPSTAGHSERVASYALLLADAVSHAALPPFAETVFTSAQLKEIRYASLLHDFGKVGVREHVLVKANKLYPRQLDAVHGRFLLAREAAERAHYQQLVHTALTQGWSAAQLRNAHDQAKAQLAESHSQLDAYLQLIEHANKPSVETSTLPDFGHLKSAAFQTSDGQPRRLVTDYELESLAIDRGSLRPEERQEIQSHVTLTFRFLSQIPWTPELENIPHIAHAHHEKLNGSGYPRGIRAEQIPLQSQIITVVDIYDALAAADRPYKKAVPQAKAFDILWQEAKAGALHASLVELFIEALAPKIRAD
jgi:HD-GYP domain-containing protein (c-di-GMP phosphodiesterase class II)